jgi:polysaccharide pyruvyl transferase WcaK-like protein
LLPDKPVIAVSLRPWQTWYERQLKSFSAVLAQCAQAWNAQVLLLPFHRPGDEWFLAEVAQCLAARPAEQRPAIVTVQEELSPGDMLAVLRRADLLVGMRLHALIMAAAVQTPALGIVYDPKIAAFAQQVDYPTLPSVEALGDSQALEAAFRDAWENRHRQRTQLLSRATVWRDMVQQNAQLAISLAEKHRDKRR